MNIGRELKIGVLAIVVIFGMIWGYNFIIGQNLLKASRTFYVNLSDVTALNVSSPVLINCYQIGSVIDIRLNKQDVDNMLVTFQIEDEEILLPKDAKVLVANDGLVGGKYLRIQFDKLCDGNNCAQDGDTFEGQQLGMIASMMGEGELDDAVGTVSKGLKNVISDLGSEEGKGTVNETLRNIKSLTSNLVSFTSTSNSLMKRSQQDLEATLKNLSLITGVIADDRERISGLLSNLDSITSDLASANLGETINNSNTAIVETTTAIKDFQHVLETTEKTMTQLSDVMTKIDSGEGTLAKLLSDDQLYTNLEFTSRNLALLLQDMRLNPKRYVSVSVFGKDQKEYVNPDEDPALKDEFIIKKIKNENK